MIKVITYGTYDLLHYGHIRLLERAKALGDYLIVGITADDFDKSRGKINVSQTLAERIEAVKATGLADEIIIEEYEGQKIDDIKRYSADIFTVGSDWVGKFDYLNEYCKVVYLERTEGISSTQLRTEKKPLRLGIVGENDIALKYCKESSFVNGLNADMFFSTNKQFVSNCINAGIDVAENYIDLLSNTDAVYIASAPEKHFEQIRTALEMGKHVLCESPIALTQSDCNELFELAKSKNLILMDAIKTAYATAYHRLVLLAKSGAIGPVVSVDATCTSLKDLKNVSAENIHHKRNSMYAWGPSAMLPVFQILGTKYISKTIDSYFLDNEHTFDLFSKVNFCYSNATACIKVGKGVKSEGELVISGTKGYIYVPAPWWKTDYFEIRFENQEENKRHFYQLDGEGIRYQLAAFAKSIESGENQSQISQEISSTICDLICDFNDKKDTNILHV